MKVVVSFEATF